MINYKFFAVTVCFLLVLSSCKSSFKSYRDDVVSLYDGQAYLMNGTYFIDPYFHTGEYTELQELFDIKKTNPFLKKLKLEFLSDKKLQITYNIGLETKTKIIKGELTKGGFQFYRNSGVFGIPWVFLIYEDERKLLYLGNDDNLIYQYYYRSYTQTFGNRDSKKVIDFIKYDRQLPLAKQ